MALALTLTNDTNGIQNHWSDTKRLHYLGTVVATGNYPALGDVLSFSNPLIKSNSPPIYVHMIGLVNAYKATFYPATGKIRFYLAGTELATGAYPVAITGDVFNFYGIFDKFI